MGLYSVKEKCTIKKRVQQRYSFCSEKREYTVEIFWVLGVLLPEGLVISDRRDSGRKYTRWKARKKLIAKCDNDFI